MHKKHAVIDWYIMLCENILPKTTSILRVKVLRRGYLRTALYTSCAS
jgi:hypothetical protein